MTVVITVRPCLLGFAVTINDARGGTYWSPGIYEGFGKVLTFLLTFPEDYTLRIK